MVIEDGAQFTVALTSKDAHLLAASFAHYLLKNIGKCTFFFTSKCKTIIWLCSGGSETFTDKQSFFYQEIRKFHQKKPHEKLLRRVERDKILQSVIIL